MLRPSSLVNIYVSWSVLAVDFSAVVNICVFVGEAFFCHHSMFLYRQLLSHAIGPKSRE
jgi:hypothetical protein